MVMPQSIAIQGTNTSINTGLLVAEILLIVGGKQVLGVPQRVSYTGNPSAGYTITWSPPDSWGEDAEGTGNREYLHNIRETLTPSGTPGTVDWQMNDAVSSAANRHFPTGSLPTNSVWEFRVAARNKNGETSDYVYIHIHAVNHTQARRFGHQFGREFG